MLSTSAKPIAAGKSVASAAEGVRAATRANNTLLVLLCLVTGMMLPGCASDQTPYHKAVREQASKRVAYVNANIAYDQARQAFDVGQFDKAEKNVDIAIATYPDAADFYLLQGRIFLETHKLEKSQKALMKALEKKEDFAEPHYFLGIVYQRWSDDERACAWYLEAFNYDPENVQYLLAAAETMVSMGDYERARVTVEDKLNYFEHNAALRQLLGQIALLEGNPELAAQQYAEARLLNPEDASLLEELARAQFDAGLYPQCFDSLSELKSLQPEPRSDLKHLEARCLLFLSRTIEARNAYIELTREMPHDAMVWIELGSIAMELGDFRRVAESSQQVVNLAPDRYEGYLLRAMYQRNKGQSKEAIESLREATARADSDVTPHLLLGRALEEAGDAAGARKAYAHAMQIDPRSAVAQELFAGASNDDPTAGN
jgi:tetratricopeptide (TPR) repeat protein